MAESLLDAALTQRGEAEPDEAVVLDVAEATDQPGGFGPIDQAGRAVVAE